MLAWIANSKLEQGAKPLKIASFGGLAKPKGDFSGFFDKFPIPHPSSFFPSLPLSMRTQTIQSIEPTFSLSLSFGRLLKRTFDIVISGLGLLILSPLFGFIAILIKRDSPGPIFYRGPRLGLGGRPFGILKFRTMREESASYEGPKVTAEGDQRITSLGKWLRDSKINELPQLWNVFVGEMSLVGPRPEDPSLIESWTPEVRTEVLSVRPGITSPASVLFRDEEKMLNADSIMDTYLGEILPSKLRLDQLYVRHHSFLADLDVLFWTFLVVLVPTLRDHKPPEDILFWGPISRFGRRYLSWFLIDTLTTFIAFGIVGVIERLAVSPLDVGLLPSVLIALTYSILFSSIAALLGIQRTAWTSASASEIAELIFPVLLALIASWALNAWLDFLLPSSIIIDASVLAFLGYIITRYRNRIFIAIFSRLTSLRRGNLLARERVLIVGAGETGQFASWRLSHTRGISGYLVVGFVDDDLFSQGSRLNGAPVLGKSEQISALVEKHDIGLIIFAIHNISPVERRAILNNCRKTKAGVVTWPDTLGLLRLAPGQGNARPAVDLQRTLNSPQQGDMLMQWLDVLEADLSAGDFHQVMEDLGALRAAIQKNDLNEVKEA